MRLAIGTVFLLVSAGLLYEAVFQTLPQRISDLFLNLGTELLGIVLTVSVIDFMLERRRVSEEARRIARECLHDIDHHVWAWQGGSREFNVDELYVLIEEITNDDPIAHFTETLFLVLGSKASNTLRTRSSIVASNLHLKDALSQIATLCRIRDRDSGMSPEEIAETLRSALPGLTFVSELDRATENAITPWDSQMRDRSQVAQEWRHYGRR